MDRSSSNRWAPHPDSSVLHAPGTCTKCDRYPERQHFRIEHLLNFTNEPGPISQPRPVTGAWR